jgi:gluconolactonase
MWIWSYRSDMVESSHPVRFVLLVCLLASCGAADDASKPRQAPDAEVRRLATGMGFTEGPVWLPDQKILVFSDIPASTLMQWSEHGGLAVFREAEQPNGNLLDLEDRLLTCQHGARNIIRTETDGSVVVLADNFEGKRFNSPNDVAVMSNGTLWFTDPPWGLPNHREGKEIDGHWVYRLNPTSGEITAVIRDLAMPNGIAFSPDETHLYVADTGGLWTPTDFEHHDAAPTLSAYEIDPHGDVRTQPVWRVETLCDGMCIDERGNIYATGETGVTIWSPRGELRGTIPVPEQPANVCFGGESFKTLFITAQTSLYAVDLEVAGHLPRAAK